MVEITLGKNLVASERPAFPALHPLIDLTQDLDLARKLAVIATRFFWLGEAVFSGFARPLDAFDGEPYSQGPAFYLQMWHGAKIFRTIGLLDLPYTGVLNIEIPAEDDPKDYFDRDLLGDLCKGSSHLPEDYASTCIGYVRGEKMDITIPVDPLW